MNNSIDDWSEEFIKKIGSLYIWKVGFHSAYVWCVKTENGISGPCFPTKKNAEDFALSSNPKEIIEINKMRDLCNTTLIKDN